MTETPTAETTFRNIRCCVCGRLLMKVAGLLTVECETRCHGCRSLIAIIANTVTVRELGHK